LRDYLVAARVSAVVMESSGDYWKPFYYLLEADLNLILVNAREAKTVPGRKTDVADAVWLADLGGHGPHLDIHRSDRLGVVVVPEQRMLLALHQVLATPRPKAIEALESVVMPEL
jgi:transposase